MEWGNTMPHDGTTRTKNLNAQCWVYNAGHGERCDVVSHELIPGEPYFHVSVGAVTFCICRNCAKDDIDAIRKANKLYRRL